MYITCALTFCLGKDTSCHKLSMCKTDLAPMLKKSELKVKGGPVKRAGESTAGTLGLQSICKQSDEIHNTQVLFFSDRIVHNRGCCSSPFNGDHLITYS